MCYNIGNYVSFETVFGGVMKREHKDIIYSLKLFEGCSRADIDMMIISRGALKAFGSGQIMEAEHSPSVGILISGRGVIYSSDKGRQTILKFIAPGNAVGVASLFADDPPNTRIVACGDGKSEMLFIERSAFEDLLKSERSARFRINLVCFLADRVSFLNSKIDYVTAGNADRRLAIFIKNTPLANDGSLSIGMSMTSLALALDIGRASLYRALDSLEEQHIISREGKRIFLLSSEKLEQLI